MATRKPLVLINGVWHELPDGDQIQTGQAGSANAPVMPMVTGETPGPVFLHDENGQCVGAPLI